MATQVHLTHLQTPSGSKIMDEFKSMHLLPTGDSKPSSANYQADLASAPKPKFMALVSDKRNSTHVKHLDSMVLRKRSGLFDVDSSSMMEEAY